MKKKMILCALCVATHSGYGEGSTMGGLIAENTAFGVMDAPDFIQASKSIIRAASGKGGAILKSVGGSLKSNIVGLVLVGGMIAMEEIMNHNNLRKACSGLLALDHLNQNGEKSEFRSGGVQARLSGGKKNQVLTCTHKDNANLSRTIDMQNAEGIDTFNIGGQIFGVLCMAEKEKEEKGEKCDPSKEFCFQPDRVGSCQFIPMPHAAETASEHLKGNKAKAGHAAEAAAMVASTIAYTNPVIAGATAATVATVAVARTAMQKKCKKQCAGYFLQEANKRGIKGKLDYGTDVRFAIDRSLANRQCFCEYRGSFQDIPTHHMFNQRTERQHGDYIDTYRNAKKERKKCNPEQKMCLI